MSITERLASILWRDAAKAELAAEALRITAGDLGQLGIVDAVVPEPEGGAHLDHEATAPILDSVLVSEIDELAALSPPDLTQALPGNFPSHGTIS